MNIYFEWLVVNLLRRLPFCCTPRVGCVNSPPRGYDLFDNFDLVTFGRANQQECVCVNSRFGSDPSSVSGISTWTRSPSSNRLIVRLLVREVPVSNRDRHQPRSEIHPDQDCLVGVVSPRVHLVGTTVEAPRSPGCPPTSVVERYVHSRL